MRITAQRPIRWLVLGAGVTVAMVILVAWPIGELFAVASEQLGNAGTGRFDWQTVVNTLLVGSAAAALTVTLGAGAAFLTERWAVPGRRWLRLGFVLPILIPPFVSALSWIRTYGPSGLTDDLLGVRLPGIFGPAGIVLLITVNAMPLAYVVTVAALNSRIGSGAEAAARASGAAPPTVARTITLPLLAPALLGSTALVFVIGINAFGIPAVLGTPASFDTVTTRIYQDLALSARPESFSRAVLLAAGLVVIAFVFVVLAESVLRQVGEGRRLAGDTISPTRPGSRRYLLSILAWGFILAVTVLPLMMLILVALTKGVGLAPVPANWTLGNFREALDGRLLGALGRSLALAAAAATVAVVLGSSVAAFRRRKLGRLASVVVLLSFAVPGSTLAVGMLLSYGRVLRDTLLIILLAYVAKLWAVAHRVVGGSTENLPRELYFAARASGASGVVALRTVVAPLLRPALIGAWALVFVVGFHELTMSSLLYGPGTDTLAVAILNLQQLGDVPVSSALAVLLTVPLLVAAFPLLTARRITRQSLGPG